MLRRLLFICGLLWLSLFSGCTQSPTTAGSAGENPQAQTQPPAQPTAAVVGSDPPTVQPATAKSSVPVYTFEVKHTFPHDPQAFTQGLICIKDGFYESTGLYGRSSLRQVERKTGKVLKKIDVPKQFFAEGMTLFHDKLFQITWQEHKCFVYDPQTFKKTGEFDYPGEGWGLTHDDKLLIMSDGTNVIRFLDPDNFQQKRSITIVNPNDGKPLKELNELEYVKGEIYANIWQTDDIVRIDPETGKVLGFIDLTDLYPLSARAAAPGSEKPDVLNGIAYDAANDALYVTGKLWPNLYEITLKKQ